MWCLWLCAGCSNERFPKFFTAPPWKSHGWKTILSFFGMVNISVAGCWTSRNLCSMGFCPIYPRNSERLKIGCSDHLPPWFLGWWGIPSQHLTLKQDLLGCANRDEQMSNGWSCSLLNDGQMSNKGFSTNHLGLGNLMSCVTYVYINLHFQVVHWELSKDDVKGLSPVGCISLSLGLYLIFTNPLGV